MDAITKLAEQRSDEMREEIDSTRSDLAEKLETLEGRVMGNVESAQETVEESIQIAKETVATVKATFDIKQHIAEHPWAIVGGCILAGLALSGLLRRGKKEEPREERRLNGEEREAIIESLAPRPTPLAPPPLPGLLDLFHDEIAAVKVMAIGYVMGLARDAIIDAVPKMAPQLEGLMNNITTKLGGMPEGSKQ